MNITSRMLSIATFILWLTIVFFSITAVYSVLNLSVTMGEVQMLPSGAGISLTLPFSIINNGYYEIADLNLTTRVTDLTGNIVDITETFLGSIPQGTTVNSSHIVEIDIEDVLSLDRVNLLLNDSEFNVEIFAGLNFARAVPVQLALNTSIPWGAPIADFSIGTIASSPYNGTHVEAAIPLSFENHAILDIEGLLKLDYYTGANEKIASGMTIINVGSGNSYDDSVSMFAVLSDESKLTRTGNLHLIFETLLFTVDWWEPYG